MDHLLQNLLGADLVLPEQFYSDRPPESALSGERALMWAVFVDGIECFRRTGCTLSGRRTEEYRETQEWMQTTDWDSVFSFVNLCEVFGFNPESLRRALLDWQQMATETTRRQRFRPVTLHAAA